jgi:hypothetical protein
VNRLLVLAVLTAVIVPTTILGARAGFGHAAGRSFAPVKTVERAFAAERILLTVKSPAFGQQRWTRLGGSAPGGFSPDVQVYRPGLSSASSVYLVAQNSAASRRIEEVSLDRGNVTVSWSTRGAWRPQAARVRAALYRLPLSSSVTVSESCLALRGFRWRACGA